MKVTKHDQTSFFQEHKIDFTSKPAINHFNRIKGVLLNITILADAKQAFDKISGPFIVTLNKLAFQRNTLNMKKDIPKQPTAQDRLTETRPRTLSLCGSCQHCPWLKPEQ